MTRQRKRKRQSSPSSLAESPTQSRTSSPTPPKSPTLPKTVPANRKAKFDLRYETSTKTPEEVLGERSFSCSSYIHLISNRKANQVMDVIGLRALPLPSNTERRKGY
jgi:hypothetical protein